MSGMQTSVDRRVQTARCTIYPDRPHLPMLWRSEDTRKLRNTGGGESADRESALKNRTTVIRQRPRNWPGAANKAAALSRQRSHLQRKPAQGTILPKHPEPAPPPCFAHGARSLAALQEIAA